jgi:hypothetical protein
VHRSIAALLVWSPLFRQAIICAALLLVATVALLSSHARSADILVSHDKTMITIFGPIEEGDEDKFSRAVGPETKSIYLHSVGGRFTPSLRIANTVKRMGFETVVARGGTCESGCALIWFTGTPRRILSGGRIGLHSVRLEGDPDYKRHEDGTRLMTSYLRGLGNVPEAVIDMLAKTEPTRMRYIGRDEATMLGLVADTLQRND